MTPMKLQLRHVAAVVGVLAFCVLLSPTVMHLQSVPVHSVYAMTVLVVALLSGLALRSLTRTFRSHADRVAPPWSSRQIWIVRGLVMGLYAAMAISMRSYDLSYDDFFAEGWSSILSYLCRLTLAPLILISCCTIGARLFELLTPEAEANTPLLSTVLNSFTGAAVLSLMACLAGLLGVLSFEVSFAALFIILYFAPAEVERCWGDARAWWWGRSSTGWDEWALWVWCVMAAGLLLLTRGLYPGEATRSLVNDVWEHYIHYYRAVIDTGSLGPHATWYHYYLSKGAGLFFLFAQSGDLFAPQIVSWCFVLGAGVLLVHVVRRALGDARWALLAGILFFLLYRGSFLKHHHVLTGCIAFLIWAASELISNRQEATRRIWVASAVVGFYIGFYQPYGALLIAASWAVLALLCAIRSPERLRDFLLLEMAVGAGVALSLVINYTATGMAEMVPIRFFWDWADRTKFTALFGQTNLAFFLENEGGGVLTDIDVDWLALVYRLNYFGWAPAGLVIVGALMAVRRAAQAWSADRLRRHTWAVGPIVFLLLSIVFSQLIRGVSLPRLYSFVLLFSVAICVILLKNGTDLLLWRRWRSWGHAVCILSMGMLFTAQELYYLEPHAGDIRGYLSGRLSFGGVLIQTDGFYNNSTTFLGFFKLRHEIPPDAPLLTLVGEPSPGYAFPGAGIISEPSYTVLAGGSDLLFGPASRIRKELRLRDIDHFHVNLRSSLRSSLVHTSLFTPANFAGNFRVKYSAGDLYLLTWRHPGDADVLPDRLCQVLELKQTGVLHEPFTSSFSADITQALQTYVAAMRTIEQEGLEETIARALEDRWLGRTWIPRNSQLLESIVSTAKSGLRQILPDLAREALVNGSPESTDADIAAQLQRITVGIFRRSVELRAARALGDTLTALLISTDERGPFGKFMASRAVFAERVQ